MANQVNEKSTHDSVKHPLAQWMEAKGIKAREVERRTAKRAEKLGIPDRGRMPLHQVYRVLKFERPPSHAQAVVLADLDRSMRSSEWLEFYQALEQGDRRVRVFALVADVLAIDVSEVERDETARLVATAVLADTPESNIGDATMRTAVAKVRAGLAG